MHEGVEVANLDVLIDVRARIRYCVDWRNGDSAVWNGALKAHGGIESVELWVICAGACDNGGLVKVEGGFCRIRDDEGGDLKSRVVDAGL